MTRTRRGTFGDDASGSDGRGNGHEDLCNTLGVCHQLSNGFELKHGMLRGDRDVRSTYENEPPLKLGPFTITYMLPFSKNYAWEMLDVLVSCVSHQYPSILIHGKVS